MQWLESEEEKKKKRMFYICWIWNVSVYKNAFLFAAICILGTSPYSITWERFKPSVLTHRDFFLLGVL